MYVRLLSEPLRQVGAAHNWLRAHCVDSGAVVELEDDAILPFEDCHELPIPDERVRISALAVRDIIGQRPRTIVAKSGAMDSDDIMVGSTIVDGPGVSAASTSPAPDRTSVSFLLDPRDGTQVALPETGRTWRPSVDPTGRWAVYWTGTLRRTGGPADVPDSGSLVLGDWGTGDNRSATAPQPTPQNQASDRHETTIAKGRVPDWDARWDPTGTKLAIWVADPSDPHVGTLSLYSVATFDGRIDLKKPLLDARRANAGFAISNGKLVWAEPTDDGSGPRERISVLAWTDDGVGTIETLPDNVVVIR